MKNKPKLWIVSEIFYPDMTTTAYILTEVAKYMSAYYNVGVLTGPVGYDKGNIADDKLELPESINIIRTSCFIKNKNGLFLRMLRQIILTFKLIWNFIFYASSKDKVLIVTNPAPLLFVMALLRQCKRVELNVLVHDVFPENALPAGIFKSPDHFLYKMIKSLFSWAYAHTDRLIVLGRDMKAVIQEKIKDSKVIPIIDVVENWADIETIFPVGRDRFLGSEYASRVVFGYAGNYGRVQGLMNLLPVVKRTRNKMIYFRFWGSGVMETEVKNYVSQNHLENVEINGAYSRDEQLKILNSYDIALVTLAPGMYGLGVPSKAYNILAAGKPIVFIGDENSEIARMVTENEVGWVFNSFEDDGFITFLDQIDGECRSAIEMMKDKCRRLAETKYAKNVVLERFYSVLK